MALSHINPEMILYFRRGLTQIHRNLDVLMYTNLYLLAYGSASFPCFFPTRLLVTDGVGYSYLHMEMQAFLLHMEMQASFYFLLHMKM